MICNVSSIGMSRTMTPVIFTFFYFSNVSLLLLSNSKYLFVCNNIQDKHQVRTILYRKNLYPFSSHCLIFVVGVHFQLGIVVTFSCTFSTNNFRKDDMRVILLGRVNDSIRKLNSDVCKQLMLCYAGNFV